MQRLAVKIGELKDADPASRQIRDAFTEYVVGLAEDGDTIMLGRQKALKGAWAPVLPEKLSGIPDDAALYINTSLFSKEMLASKGVKATKENAVGLAFLMLDDVGTKSKEPSLTPTWKLETSEGNYQWGYIFKEQPFSGEYTDVVRELAALGYGDPGAATAVRWARIPGSKNLKPTANHFKARLAEWHPELEYTLEEIAHAFGLEVGERAENKKVVPLKTMKRKDEVLTWLSEQGLILEAPNNEGWATIVCPNNSEHSDGEVAAHYHPGEHVFKCFHGHCASFNSKEFLDWVAENGGPRVAPGEMTEEDRLRFAAALEKAKGRPEGETTAEAMVRELQQKEASRVARQAIAAEILERYVFVEDGSEGYVFDTKERCAVKNTLFNNMYSSFQAKSSQKKGSNNQPALLNALGFLLEFKPERLRGLTYHPGEEGIINIVAGGGLYGNKWKDMRPKISDAQLQEASDEKVSPWLGLLRRVVPNDVEREHLLDVLATKIQQPATKINVCILLGGVPGCGKDSALLPFYYAVGGINRKGERMPRSARSKVDTSVLERNWGYHLETEVIAVNELYSPSDSGKRKIANLLKDLGASGAGEELVIETKGNAPYTAPNKLLLVATTNYTQPIGVEKGDRRWFFIWSSAPPMTREESLRYYDWLHNQGGMDAVAAWLQKRDVTKFNPKEGAPMTDAKSLLIDRAMTLGESAVMEAVGDPDWVFRHRWVSSPWRQLASEITQKYSSGSETVRPSHIHQQLGELGWVQVRGIHSRRYPIRRDFWMSREFYKRYQSGEISPSDLRDQAEEVFTQLRHLGIRDALKNASKRPSSLN